MFQKLEDQFLVSVDFFSQNYFNSGRNTEYKVLGKMETLAEEVVPTILSKAIENQDFRDENQPVGFVDESTSFASPLLSKTIVFGNNF